MKPTHIFYLMAIGLSAAHCGKKSESAEVLRRDITELVFATGTLKADDEYFLTAQADGYLTVLFFEEGDMVAVGKPMALIDNKQSLVNAEQSEKLLRVAERNADEAAPLLQQTRTNIGIAIEKQKQDERQARRFQKLYESNSVAKVELENAQLALANSTATVKALEEQYRNLKTQADQQLLAQQQQSRVNSTLADYNRIVAPVGGRVYLKKKQRGDYVRKGDVVAVIANPDKVYALLNLDESNMGKVKLGQAVTIQLNTHDDQNLQGSIAEILPSFDLATQSFLVKAFFDEPPGFSIAGTQLQANILVAEKKAALVIPRKFLGYGSKVLLKDKTTVVVKTGIISSEWAEITDGLQEKQAILTELK